MRRKKKEEEEGEDTRRRRRRRKGKEEEEFKKDEDWNQDFSFVCYTASIQPKPRKVKKSFAFPPFPRRLTGELPSSVLVFPTSTLCVSPETQEDARQSLCNAMQGIFPVECFLYIRNIKMRACALMGIFIKSKYTILVLNRHNLKLYFLNHLINDGNHLYQGLKDVLQANIDTELSLRGRSSRKRKLKFSSTSSSRHFFRHVFLYECYADYVADFGVSLGRLLPPLFTTFYNDEVHLAYTRQLLELQPEYFLAHFRRLDFPPYLPGVLQALSSSKIKMTKKATFATLSQLKTTCDGWKSKNVRCACEDSIAKIQTSLSPKSDLCQLTTKLCQHIPAIFDRPQTKELRQALMPIQQWFRDNPRVRFFPQGDASVLS